METNRRRCWARPAVLSGAASSAETCRFFTVVNAGPNTAPSVDSVLPSGATFESATATQGAGCAEELGIVSCSLGDLTNGAPAEVTIVVVPERRRLEVDDCVRHVRSNGRRPGEQRSTSRHALLIRTIFVEPDHDTAVIQLRAVVDQLEPPAPGVARRLADMEADLLADTGLPPAHWSKIGSNNPIERLNRELKRRTDVVGIFPDTASVICLVDALLVEINDEMIAADRRYIAAASVAEIDGIQPELPSLPAAPRDKQNNREPHGPPTPHPGTQSDVQVYGSNSPSEPQGIRHSAFERCSQIR